MKKLIIAAVFILLAGITFGQNKIDIENNKKVATIYHDLKVEDIDNILTEDFIGRNEKSRRTWNRENHRQAWSKWKGQDKILHLIAEGELVAIRFVRTVELEGEILSIEAMHIMRFENGKIAEIWECYDTKQSESEDE